MATTLDLSAEYDDGSFDKDEQGWCSRWTRVSQEGDLVIVRQWGDDNGARPYDSTRTGTVAELLPDHQLVRLGGGLAGSYFDLRTRRLRASGEQECIRGPAWPGYIEPAGVARGLDLLLTVLEAVTGRPASRPVPPAWTPLVPSATWQGSHESILRFELEEIRFHLARHDVPGRDPHMTIGVTSPQASVYMHIGGEADAMAVVSGPLERREAAREILRRAGLDA